MTTAALPLEQRRDASVGFRLRLPDRVRTWLRFALARGKELFGIDHFPARSGLDRALLRHLGDVRGGVFIEAGAYDGLCQSNSWHFERRLGWTGLLVEPIPESAAHCRRFRKARVEACALGSFAQEGSVQPLYFGGLMTTGDGAARGRLDGGTAQSHATAGATGIGRTSYGFEAPVVALSTLIDRHRLGPVDLLSLDVEGFELAALAGIDFDRHPIRYLLIETVNPVRVLALLGDRYELIEQLAAYDYLFRLRATEAANG